MQMVLAAVLVIVFVFVPYLVGRVIDRICHRGRNADDMVMCWLLGSATIGGCLLVVACAMACSGAIMELI